MEILQNLQKPILYLMIAILIFNMTQRSHQKYGEKKRFATLNMALILLLLNGSIAVILNYSLSPYYIIIGIVLAATAAWIMRSRTFVFRLRCPECGTLYEYKDVLYRDEPLCRNCNPGGAVPDKVDDIDWDRWSPKETAVLCFITSEDKVLLIHKKTGLGAGKINAPGGRIEEQEIPAAAAVRETMEETGLVPSKLEECVHLHFQFKDGYALKGHVFTADSYEGELRETEEADPFWCEKNAIPYDKMWADDALWIPDMLAGKKRTGWFIFDGDSMIDHKVIDGIDGEQ